MNKSVAIIGAGSVGTNTAIFLSKLGLDVYLFDSQDDILQGAPIVSFINHGDGFEYYKAGHQATGKFCIDGSLVKGLIYPLKYFRTQVVSEDNPIRFLVSTESSINNVDLDDFYDNAKRMKAHFTAQFQSIKKAKNLTEEQAKHIFLRTPDTFYNVLKPEEYWEINHIAGGCSGSSFGINMAQYFAYLKAAMISTGVIFFPKTRINCIEKTGNNYLVHTDSTFFKVNYILVTANHHIPNLANTARNFDFKYRASGTYYLNSMTFLDLPPTKDDTLIEKVSHINFTLQGENGGMFACIVPPTHTEHGLAATYFPSVHGSQLDNHIYDKDHPSLNPNEWENFILNGLPISSEFVQKTFQQACSLYPFLANYAKIKNTLCRPVFNASVRDSPKGVDRRVREIRSKPIMLSEDEHVSMWASPKWTNAELVALMATDHICQLAGLPELPKTGKTSFGPTQLDVAKISDSINFYNLEMDISDAYHYAKTQTIPERVVDNSISAFM